MPLAVEFKNLYVPTLDEVSEVLQRALEGNFAEVQVTVTDCPNLKDPPFNLSGGGLCGSPRLADVGGPPYLAPCVDKTKNYDIAELTKIIDLPDAFVVGAGAGPHLFVGTNSEMMSNIVTGKNPVNGSRISKITDERCQLEKLPEDQARCSLMVNLFASEGLAGKIIKVHVRKRIGVENFVTCMRKALEKEYVGCSVGLGGIFLLTAGSVKCHVMPAFSTTPLKSDEDINNWLKFFNMPAPMIFFSEFVSRDPGMDLRIEHTHGYGDSYGGHYHYDVTPDEVEYEGYFNVAEVIYRIDRPANTHHIGRNSGR